MRVVIFAAGLTLLAQGALGQPASWGCGVDGFSGKSRETAASLSTSNQMGTAVREYMHRWDAQHMREQCENFSNGRPSSIGCLNESRDWDAIVASIPSEYFTMERRMLGKIVQRDIISPKMVEDAVKYCEDVGATRKR